MIFFLFRKFSAKERENFQIMENLNQLKAQEKGRMGNFFSNLWLKILENIAQKVKSFSLKIHGFGNSWFNSVRSKRKRNILSRPSDLSETTGKDIVADKKEIVIEDSLPKNEGIVEIETKKQILGDIEKPQKTKRFSFKRTRARIDSSSSQSREVMTEREPQPQKMVVQKSELEEALIKRIAVNPKDIEAYERLGDYYSDIKNFNDSVECYRQVIKLSPRNFKVKFKLKNLERVLKKNRKAN